VSLVADFRIWTTGGNLRVALITTANASQRMSFKTGWTLAFILTFVHFGTNLV
jgi:hypothetical protein